MSITSKGLPHAPRLHALELAGPPSAAGSSPEPLSEPAMSRPEELRHTERSVVIPRRFRGPPDSANGGYACGLIAEPIGRSARVRLVTPPALDRPLSLRVLDQSRTELFDDALLVGEGVVEDLHGEIPAPVGFAEAERARQRFRGDHDHPFPGCFVCGTRRSPDDGLCIHPGLVEGTRVVAAPWIPAPSVCDEKGLARTEVVWAALDCPSWFGILEFEEGATFGLLGQLTADVQRRPRLAEPCVIVGWAEGRSGRKMYGGTAIFGSGGELLARSAAIWIEPTR
jgi:hypothetical protein